MAIDRMFNVIDKDTKNFLTQQISVPFCISILDIQNGTEVTKRLALKISFSLLLLLRSIGAFLRFSVTYLFHIHDVLLVCPNPLLH